jgi:uncharacterized damage-inducible protein DinB
MNTSDLTDLFRHMEWADAAVWTAVLANEAGREDAKLRGYLHHLHVVQRAFLRTWRGEPRDAPYPDFDATPPMIEWAREYYPEALAQVEAWTDDQVAEPMPVPWASMVERRIGRPPAMSSLADTALQVAMHSQYHRGQVNARLREVGGEPPLVDYIGWVWLGRPKAEWPVAAD